MRMYSFCCSPIDRERFKLIQQENNDEDLSSNYNVVEEIVATYKQQNQVAWQILLSPVQLSRAIKQYHMCDNKFFIHVGIQFVLLVYLLSKSLFHIIYTGSDQTLATYYENQYYFPRLFESYPEPQLFYSLTLSICLYSFSIRIFSTYKLIKSSLINLNGYKELDVGQINLSYLTFPNWCLKDWFTVIKSSFNYCKKCRQDPIAFKNYIKLNKLMAEKVSKLSNHNLMYDSNVIDFDECYKDFEHLYDANKRDEKFRNWHYSLPIHRVDPFVWAILTFNIVIITWFSIFLIVLVCICLLYLELLSVAGNEINYGFSDLVRVFSNLPIYLIEPKYLIRLFDIYAYVLIQLPNQFDAMPFYFNSSFMYSRTRKLVDCLQSDLDFCRQGIRNLRAKFDSQEQNELSDLNQQFNLWQASCCNFRFNLAPDGTKTNPWDVNGIKELNDRLWLMAKLTRRLRIEFLSVKKCHSGYLNLVVVSSGFCIAYCVSLILRAKSYSQLFCLSVNTIGSLMPLVTIVFFSILMDNAVSMPWPVSFVSTSI